MPKAPARILCIDKGLAADAELPAATALRILVSVDEPTMPLAGPPSLVVCPRGAGSSAPGVRFYWHEAQAVRELAAVAAGAYWSVGLPQIQEGLALRVLARPWQGFSLDLPEPPAGLAAGPEHRLLVPAFGFAKPGGLWCDGWLAHLCPDGRAASLLPPGSALRLQLPFPLQEAPEALALPLAHERLGLVEGELARRCVVTALQFLVDGVAPQELRVADWTPATALAAVLVRQAFPQATIALRAAVDFSTWPKGWKQLASRLGMRPQAGKASAVPSSLESTRVLSLLPVAQRAGVWQAVQELSQILAGFSFEEP